MKKLLLIVSALLWAGTAIYAQQPQNPGFEDWTNQVLWEDPDSFFTSNWQAYFMGGMANVESTQDAHTGTYAAKLNTITNGTDTIPAMLSNGKAGSGGFAGGTPYTEMPDSFSFWAKHTIAAGDSAMIFTAFMRQGNMGGFGLARIGGTTSTYTKYTFPISYFMVPGQTPDTLLVIIMSADFNGAVTTQSEFIIDDLTFHGTSQIADNSFEHWTTFQTEEPDHWFTFNFFSLATLGVPSVIKSNDSYEGMYALQLTTIPLFDDTMGVVTNGSMGDDGVTGGLPVYYNPWRLTGYYKYMPVGPDTALAGLFSSQWNSSQSASDLVEEVMVKLPPTMVYTPFSVELNYNAWPLIDTLNIAFSSSNSADSTAYTGVGSTLLIDSLRLEYFPVGLGEDPANADVSLFPNPASATVNLTATGNGIQHLELFTLTGSRVKDMWVRDGASIDVSMLAPGDYLYLVTGQQGAGRGKLKIIR